MLLLLLLLLLLLFLLLLLLLLFFFNFFFPPAGNPGCEKLPGSLAVLAPEDLEKGPKRKRIMFQLSFFRGYDKRWGCI